MRPTCGFFLCSLLPLVTNEALSPEQHMRLRLWCLFLGEIPAALLVVVGTLILFLPRRGSVVCPDVLAGVLLGLATNTKRITALCVGGVITAYIASQAWSVVRGRFAQRRLGRFTLGLLIPLLVYETTRLASLGSVRAWLQLQAMERSHFIRHGSGLEDYLVSMSRLTLAANNAARNWQSLVGSVYGWHYSAVFCSLAIVLLGARGLWIARRATPELRAATGLLWAYLVTLGWWLVASPSGWPRYLMPGFVCGWVGVCCMLANDRNRTAGVVTGAILLLTIAPRVQEVPKVFWPRLSREPRLTALLDTRDFLAQPAFADVQLLGCSNWINLDLEYLLPATCRFRDCFSASEHPTDTRSSAILVRSEYWNWEKDEALQRIQDHCDERVIFRCGPFVVSECRDLSTVMNELPAVQGAHEASDSDSAESR